MPETEYTAQDFLDGQRLYGRLNSNTPNLDIFKNDIKAAFKQRVAALSQPCVISGFTVSINAGTTTLDISNGEAYDGNGAQYTVGLVGGLAGSGGAQTFKVFIRASDGTFQISSALNDATKDVYLADAVWDGSKYTSVTNRINRPIALSDIGGSMLNGKRVILSDANGVLSEAPALTNGQLLIGSTGNAPVAAALTGTANQVNVTNGAGSITLSLPQNIHSGASPTFGGMTLNGNLTLGEGTSLILGTTTGVKIGTDPAQKVGFFNATPIARPSAYTQTYSTASKTHNNPASATLTDNSGGTAGTTLAAILGGGSACENATKDAIASLAAQINNLRADLLNLKQVVNSIIDDLQSLGLFS